MLRPIVLSRLAFVPMPFDKSRLTAPYINEGPRLERYLVKRWRLSAAAAADVVQEAFIRLMRVPQQQDIRDVPRHLRRLSRPQPSTIAARREEAMRAAS